MKTTKYFSFLLLLVGIQNAGAAEFLDCLLGLKISVSRKKLDIPDKKQLDVTPSRVSLKITFDGTRVRRFDMLSVYKYQHFKALRGKIIDAFPNAERFEFLFPEDCSPAEVQLAFYLQERSRSPEFSSQGGKSVEFAAWRIELKNGKVFTIPHTSAEERSVSKSVIFEDLEKVLLSKKVTRNQIALIQYFHTHPTYPTLSKGDQLFADEVFTDAKKAGVNVPVHLYSIADVEGKMVLGHYGIQ